MSESNLPLKNAEKTKKNKIGSQSSEHGIFVKEDDQDWGSSGMNDIKKESE
tara:strand:+ start:177 stop:329 length:153 start_codon:yes stop_codon:yes gene_type:complete